MPRKGARARQAAIDLSKLTRLLRHGGCRTEREHQSCANHGGISSGVASPRHRSSPHASASMLECPPRWRPCTERASSTRACECLMCRYDIGITPSRALRGAHSQPLRAWRTDVLPCGRARRGQRRRGRLRRDHRQPVSRSASSADAALVG
jgi:hypothetical protein